MNTLSKIKAVLFFVGPAILCCLIAVCMLFSMLMCFVSIGEGQSLVRQGSRVKIIQGNGFTMEFNGDFGGAPLAWFNNGVPVTNPMAGEGVQIVYDTGQDGTQAGATGLDPYPIAQFDRPETFKYAYYGHETLAAIVNKQAVYETSSFLPYFWVSLESSDDAHPKSPYPFRWSTYYNDVLNLGFNGYHLPGVPVFFAGTPQTPVDILLIGDEIVAYYQPTAPWYAHVNKIPGGRFAFKGRVVMKYAGWDAVAGILLRKKPNLNSAADVWSVFSSPGQHLNINKQGTVQLLSNGAAIWTLPQQYWAAMKTKLDSDAGLKVEVRTHNWASESMEIYLDDVLYTTVSAPIYGEVFGLLGAGTSGRIGFYDRQFVDVGTKCTSRWESTPQGTMKGTLSVYRVAAPLVTPIYRINLPVAFTAENIRQSVFVWDQNWNALNAAALQTKFPDGWVPFVDGVWRAKALWNGNSAGTLGVWTKILSPVPENGHLIIAPSVQGLSSIPYSANFDPVPFSGEQIVVETAPSIRWDLLK